jgi:hypothetical protein
MKTQFLNRRTFKELKAMGTFLGVEKARLFGQAMLKSRLMKHSYKQLKDAYNAG